MNGTVERDTEDVATHQTAAAALRTFVECTYESTVGFTGDDTFIYDAKFGTGRFR
jgi:hypothetical protein